MEGSCGRWGPVSPLRIVSHDHRQAPAIQARSQRLLSPPLAAPPTVLSGKGAGFEPPWTVGWEEGHPVLTALSSESGMDVQDKGAKWRSAASPPGDPAEELPAWLSRAPEAVVL